MKYILLMSGTKEMFEWFSKWPKEDLQKNFAFMRNFSQQLKDEGVFVASEGLAWPDQAKFVHTEKTESPLLTGSFPESKEFLAGYWIIDVESAEQAYRIAERLSLAHAPAGTPGVMPVEIRQIMSGPPEDCSSH